MAATFYWTYSYGSSEKVVGNKTAVAGSESGASTTSAGNLNRIDFLSVDTGESIGGAGSGSPIVYSDYPIRAGNNAFERWVRGYWAFQAGTNKVTGMKLWLSSGNNTGSNVAVYALVTGTYATPVASSRAGVTSLVPTGVPSTAPSSALDITPGSPTTGITESGYSQYCILQLRTNSNAAPGDITLNGSSPIQFTMQYDEQ